MKSLYPNLPPLPTDDTNNDLIHNDGNASVNTGVSTGKNRTINMGDMKDLVKQLERLNIENKKEKDIKKYTNVEDLPLREFLSQFEPFKEKRTINEMIVLLRENTTGHLHLWLQGVEAGDFVIYEELIEELFALTGPNEENYID